MKSNQFEFCTRCGNRVTPYRCNDSLTGFDYYGDLPAEDFTRDGIYIGDWPLRFVPESYWCENCGMRWPAFATGDTSSQRSCGDFMPVYVEFCAICGTMKPVWLHLALIESSGPFRRVGTPTLLCWLSLACMPASAMSDGKIVVLHYDQIRRGWNEYTRQVTVEQAQAIIERVKRLGFPDRLPDVEGKVDTSDGWVHMSLQIEINNQRNLLAVGMQSSGFEGQDADLLRQLFRHLFDIAGFAEFDPIVYGTGG